MSNINKIKVSGQTYNIQDKNATKTLELTQAEYDALAVKDPNTFYIITDSEGIDFSNYYTRSETDDLLDTKLDVSAYTPTDLSNYYKKSETSGATQISTALASKANKSEIPSLDGYATETWVEGKGYLTEHQDISGKLDVSAFNTYSGSVNTQLNSKASESDLNDLNDTVTAHTANTTVHVTASEKSTWNAKSDFSGNYNDLSNKPTIPSKTSDLTNDSDFATTGDVQTATNDMATKTWVGQQGYLTQHQDISGKQDVSGMTAYTETSAFTAHTADTTIHVTSAEKATWNAKSDFSGDYNDLSNKPTIPTSASQLTNDSGYITSSALDDYTTTATTSALNNVVTAHTANTSIHVSAEQIAAWNAKSDFSGSYNDLSNKLSAGTNITIVDNVISAEGGGGKTIEAGRGISITTGETADTVSFSLPISAGTNSTNIIIGEKSNISNGNRSIATGNNTKAQQSNAFAQGYKTDAGQENSHAEGYETKAYGTNSHSEGKGTSAMTSGSHAEGLNTITSNSYEHTQGQYNVSNKANTTFGNSGNTLFSVGNGTSNSARHNAFEIRQNGDIYCSDGTNDVKLQDTITATAANTTALGGLSLVKLTQAQYDALVTKDNSTLYVING